MKKFLLIIAIVFAMFSGAFALEQYTSAPLTTTAGANKTVIQIQFSFPTAAPPEGVTITVADKLTPTASAVTNKKKVFYFTQAQVAALVAGQFIWYPYVENGSWKTGSYFATAVCIDAGVYTVNAWTQYYNGR